MTTPFDSALPVPPASPGHAGDEHSPSARVVLAVEASGDGIWDLDFITGIAYRSPRCHEMLGYEVGEIEPRIGAWDPFVHPDDMPALRANFTAHIEGIVPLFECEYRVRKKDGSWAWLLDRGRVVARTAEGRPARVIGVHSDITSRREADLALRESEARFRNMADHAPVILWVTDPSGRATFLNRSFHEFTGQSPAESLDFGWLNVVHPDERESVERAFREANARHAPFRAEYRLRRADGDYRWVVDTAAPRLADGGAFLGYVGTVFDIDERRRSEQALAAALERIQHQLVELEALYEATPLGLAFMDPHFRFVRVNQVMANINGVSVDEHIGRTLRDVVPSLADTVEPIYRTVLASGRPVANVEIGAQTSASPDELRHWLASFHPVHDAHGAVLGISVVVLDVTERRRMEAVLGERERMLADAQRIGRIGSWSWDVGRNVIDWSAETYRMFGVDESVGRLTLEQYLALLHPDDRARIDADTRSAMAARMTEWSTEYRILRGGRELRFIASRVAATYDGDGAPRLLQGTNLDITERVQLESRLRQAQKMEAVGQLAGGVAHDFNNLLTIINGNLEFVRREIRGNEPALADLSEVERAAERARTLVRQLLAFSRKQVLQPALLDLREVVAGAEKLLRRVIGEEIDLRTVLPDSRLVVLADAGQLEQILMNLAVNARDAMLVPLHGHEGRGGVLTIGAAARHLEAPVAHGWESASPGDYVELWVADTGHGMDAAVRDHAFEPFFTTKGVGEGTGLGLATVYGIVTQSGGHIRLESAPARGTTLRILLPSGSVEPEAPPEATSPVIPPGQGNILLVEDETAVRNTARRFLERHGYRVFEAQHGANALAIWREHRRVIDVLVTDLRMPELGGRELASILRADAPRLPVVYISGYADRSAPPSRGRHEAYLEKPFASDALLAAVHEVTTRED